MQRLTFDSKGVFDYKSESQVKNAREIYILFLNDSSLEIRRSVKVEGLKGGYFFKTMMAHVYKAKTNQHGEKYLLAYKKTDSGKVFSLSSTDLRRDDSFLYQKNKTSYYSQAGMYSNEMVEVIENHLSSMLGFPFKRNTIPATSKDDWYEGGVSAWVNTPEALCFPFLRSEENRKFVMSLLNEDRVRQEDSQMCRIMSLDWDGLRGLTAALRESASKEEFIRNLVYKSAVKTDADMQALLNSPEYLRVFSKLEMKTGAAEAITKGHAQIFNNYHRYMNIPEFFAFQFLLKNLPKTTIPEVLNFVSKLVTFRTDQHKNLDETLEELVKVQNANDFNSYRNGYRKQFLEFFRQIPVSDRQEFALEFWACFQKDYIKTRTAYASVIEKDISSRSKERNKCFVNVMDAFMKVYVDKYVKTSRSMTHSKCAETVMELFGFDLDADRQLRKGTDFYKQMILVDYYDFTGHPSKRIFRTDDTNLFSLLALHLELGEVWKSAFSSPANIIFEDKPEPMSFMLTSTLEKTLRKIAAKIDAGLVKAGQHVTVENRMIYLQTTERDRKFKVNWRYYNLGVTPKDVPAYKKAGIRSKKDITFWVETRKTLPAEMYKELLEDAGRSTSDADTITSLVF